MPSRYEMFILWIAANRKYIGWTIGLGSLAFRYVLSFAGHDEFADHLKDLAMLVLAGSAYTAAAGAHHSDEFWKERKEEATIPPQYRSPKRRKSDAKP